MGPVLLDVRGLQGRTTDFASGLLRTARAALPGRILIGLVDPGLPRLEPLLMDCLDRVYTRPHAAKQCRPECFVRLAPHDEALTARFLLDPAVPSVALDRQAASGLAGAIGRYWQSCADVVVPASGLWAAVAGLRSTRAASRLAVVSPDQSLPLCRALRRHADVFGPETLPALSPHYDHTLFVIANSGESGPLISLLCRYGGSALVLDSCLLGAYSPARAAELAARELARPVPGPELDQWRAGIGRPEALLLGEVAAAADRLFVHSSWLAGEVARRYGRSAIVVPPPHDLPRVRAYAVGLQAESCVWAVELLRSWGREVRLDLDVPQADIMALAERLGVADLVGFAPGPASLTLFLSMRGQGSLSALLGGAGRPCIASAGVAEAVDRAGLVVVPDQPSPPLLAAAIDHALPASGGADATAARILAAL